MIFEIPFDFLPDFVIQAGAQDNCQTEWSLNFIKGNVQMTEISSNAVVSTSARGEISSNKQISPIVEMTRNGNLSLVAPA